MLKYVMILALMTSSAVAFAASKTHTVPYQFQGHWCVNMEDTSVLRGCVDKDDSIFRISATGYLGHGSLWSCTFTSINYNEQRQVVHFDAMCQNQKRQRWKERGIFDTSSNYLKHLVFELRNDRHNKNLQD